jgi:hypothetical protein
MAIVQAIHFQLAANANHECITLNMCTITLEILQTLVECSQFLGILFQDNKNVDHHSMMVHVVDESLSQALFCGQYLRNQVPLCSCASIPRWNALACCRPFPALEVLWVDCLINW